MKVLITGISGFLGYNLFTVMKDHHEIIGTHLNNPLNNSIALNLANESEIKKLYNYYLPDLVIHSAAITKINDCEKNPELSYQVNSNSTITLAKLSEKHGSRLIFLSTDLVFDGKSSGYYLESDATNPINVYSKSKVNAEQFLINSSFSNYTIMRMPLMFGNGGPYGKSSSYDLLMKLKNGEKYSLFTNEYRTPMTGLEAAKSIFKLLMCPEKILHMGGPQKINRFDLAKLICQHYKLNEDLLVPTSYHGTELANSRPENASLNSNLAKQYGHNPVSLLDQLKNEN